MLSIERSAQDDHSIAASAGEFTVEEMIMTPTKIDWLWREMQKYSTLFSDLTRGDIANFAGLVLDRHSIWFEVKRTDVLVGVVYFTGMEQIVDCDAHLIFFDRKPLQKAALCIDIARLMFDKFPLNRITATIPSIYWLTLRLAKKIGFQKEGVKRQTQLMNNQWVDEVIFGLLRSEVL